MAALCSRAFVHRTSKLLPISYRSFSNFERKREDFKKVTSEDVEVFKTILSPKNVTEDPHELEPLNEDWLRHYKGQSTLAVTPESTEQLSEVLKYCQKENIAVVPQGGNTGLVGGSIPVFDEVVISLKNLNKIISLDPVLGVVVCEAGCILENVDQYLRDQGFIMPLDLGAKGSCQIGGNVATNAGGIRYVRYGSLRGNVLGMEAVLADGTVLDGLSSLRKDNTGYDIKQLLIGSEGTLGIITKLAILTPRLPESVHVVLFSTSSFEKVLQILVKARSELVDILSAIEFMDNGTMSVALEYLDGVRAPIEERDNFYVLIETSGSNEAHDREKIDDFIEKMLDEELVSGGVMAEDNTQAANLWRIREGCAEALNKHGYCYKYDVSIPCEEMYELVEGMRERLKAPAGFQSDAISVTGYGHLGDGNLHLNIVSEKDGDYCPETMGMIEPWVFEQVSGMKGSVSAEHGIGQAKSEYLGMSKSEGMISMMRTIKSTLDPKGILNPYKMFPTSE
mmetsp:Transcript_9475/g.14210  ORF Transcript_9475/g.14210 Transcript_9475/m.14210 type:complete len:509 (+) Transcript_9475:32-1558(+)